MEQYKDKKIMMVRSPQVLISQSKIGYGWDSVNFSEYKTVEVLFEDGFKGIDVGRKTNQIKNYYNLSEGDLVIIPVSRAIVLAEIQGDKLYMEGVAYGENQIKVNFLTNKDGNVAYIPRNALSTALQSRLKLRMAIANLGDFKDELIKLVASLKKGEIYTWKTEIEKKESEAEKIFKESLLDRIQTGKEIGISAGGYGLEKLIQDLLQAQGYDANIQAKNQSSGIDDIDIIAKRVNSLTDDIEALFIQVKHHKGETRGWGIQQLEAFEVNDDEISFYRKVLITTASVSEELKEHADKSKIIVLDGEQFVAWLYNNIEFIRTETRNALGISSIPTLI